MPGQQEVSATRRLGHPALLLWVLCGAQFMLVLDTTIVTVALPHIQGELHFASPGSLQLVISLYALTLGGSLVVAGRVADLRGTKPVFVIGLSAFAFASLACGAAQDPAMLLIARAVQGVGAALASAAGLAILTRAYPAGRERNRALSAWGAVGGAAGAAGLVIGGLLTQLLGWRSVFWINLPIGTAITAGAIAAVPTSHSRTNTQGLNLAGAASLMAAVGLLVFGLQRIGDHDVTHWSVPTTLAGALLAGIIYVTIERRAAAPVLPARLFAVPGTTPAYLVAFALNAVIGSSLFFTTLFMQKTLGFGPLATGAGFLPNSGLVVVGAYLAGRLAGRIGAQRVLSLGCGSIAVGTVLLATVRLSAGYVFPVLPGFALIGLGLGFGFTAFTILATEHVPDHDQGSASGVLNTAQQLGFAVGIAAIVTAAETAANPVTGYSLGYIIDAASTLAAFTASLIIFRHARPSQADTHATVDSMTT